MANLSGRSSARRRTPWTTSRRHFLSMLRVKRTHRSCIPLAALAIGGDNADHGYRRVLPLRPRTH
jgi:hypothetical protein